jgi:hypothetical protein
MMPFPALNILDVIQTRQLFPSKLQMAIEPTPEYIEAKKLMAQAFLQAGHASAIKVKSILRQAYMQAAMVNILQTTEITTKRETSKEGEVI